MPNKTITFGANLLPNGDNEFYLGNSNAHWIIPNTVTNVQIQATSPLTSSQSAAQSESLNTTISFIKTTANYVLAGPTSGSTSAIPTLRQLVSDDIPNLGAGKITSGTFAADRIPTIANDKLQNKKITIAGSEVELGGSLTLADIGLAGAMHFKGTVTSVPNATATTTFNTYEAGDVILGPSSKEYVYNKGANAASSTWVELGSESSFKVKQTTVSDPTAGSTATTNFISAISQNIEGVITATKSPLPVGTDSVTGIVKLGTAAAEAAKGNHAHGNISNTGTLGSTATYGVATDANKKIIAIDLSTTAPNASGTSTVFVSSVTADTQGKIYVNRANLPVGTSSVTGIVKLGVSGGAATYDHGHGNISNSGTISTSAVIANGDHLTLSTSANSGKLVASSITFDGSTTSQAITKAGTWETFNNYIVEIVRLTT